MSKIVFVCTIISSLTALLPAEEVLVYIDYQPGVTLESVQQLARKKAQEKFAHHQRRAVIVDVVRQQVCEALFVKEAQEKKVAPSKLAVWFKQMATQSDRTPAASLLRVEATSSNPTHDILFAARFLGNDLPLADYSETELKKMYLHLTKEYEASLGAVSEEQVIKSVAHQWPTYEEAKDDIRVLWTIREQCHGDAQKYWQEEIWPMLQQKHSFLYNYHTIEDALIEPLCR